MKLVLVIFIFLGHSLLIAEDTLPLVPEYNKQNISSFTWEEVPVKDFLSFKKWKTDTDIKEKTPEWEQAVLARRNKEVAGRFFQCVGTCHVERGAGFFNPNYRSTIYENDEIQTIGESYAWIFLLDGTMVRLSPESSITINEINIGIEENFLNARINMGNVLWMSRLENNIEENNYRETEALFFPLNVFEANPIISPVVYNRDNLLELTERRKTNLYQRERLNSLIDENNFLTNGKKTFSILTLPNVTLMGRDLVVETVSLMGGETYFRKKTPEEQELISEKEASESEVQYQLRGYENHELVILDSDNWMVADAKGDSVNKVEDDNLLKMSSFITKRIPSILVARELLMQKYSEVLYKEKYDRTLLARNEGYRLWDSEEMAKRLSFIKEYFRRVETTNLTSSVHFIERMKLRGVAIPSIEYSNKYFIKALDRLMLYDPYTEVPAKASTLNSTSKHLWKVIHGIR